MSNWLHDLINDDFAYINKYTLNFNFNASNKKNCFFKFHDLNEFVFNFVKKTINKLKKNYINYLLLIKTFIENKNNRELNDVIIKI